MPPILEYTLKSKIIQLVDFLKSVIVSDVEVIASLKRGAMNITGDFRRCIRPKVEVLKQVGLSYHVISFALINDPLLFNSNDHFSKGVKEVIELGFKPLQVSFVRALVVVIQMSKSKRESKVEAFKRLGCSNSEISAAFRSFPNCMLLFEKKIMSRMEYFVKKMGLKPSDVIRNAVVLSYSLEKRIIPRGSVVRFLQLKGFLKKDLNYHGLLVLAERQFLDKFVITYKEQVPQLFSFYEGKFGFLKQRFGPEDLRGIAQL